MSEKQLIKTVYSTKERALLASLVETHKEKLESKKTDGTTNSVKNETWQIISDQYNTHDVTSRTPIQLKKCWENMKYKTRKADTQARHCMLLTGGGPPEKDTTDVLDDMVRAIVPTINYTLSNVWDSSGILESDQVATNDAQVKCNEQIRQYSKEAPNKKITQVNLLSEKSKQDTENQYDKEKK